MVALGPNLKLLISSTCSIKFSEMFGIFEKIQQLENIGCSIKTFLSSNFRIRSILNVSLKMVALGPCLKLFISSTCSKKISEMFCIFEKIQQLEYIGCSINTFLSFNFRMSSILNARLEMVELGPCLKLLISFTCSIKISEMFGIFEKIQKLE